MCKVQLISFLAPSPCACVCACVCCSYLALVVLQQRYNYTPTRRILRTSRRDLLGGCGIGGGVVVTTMKNRSKCVRTPEKGESMIQFLGINFRLTKTKMMRCVFTMIDCVNSTILFYLL
jgi:hypothetical protein